MTQTHQVPPPSTPKRIWASLITNMGYLPGLLTLHHSLYHPQPDPRSTPTKGPNNTTTNPAQGSRYPFIALYTSTFPPEGLKVLQARGIQAQWVPNVTPARSREYTQDPRFAETWTKLVAFSLAEYERVVLLDGDILVRRNMDELMELELDSRASLEQGGEEGRKRVFAAAHACACNPLKKAHYPADWSPKNCAYTTQHNTPARAQKLAPPPTAGIGMLNSGVLVITPSPAIYGEITAALEHTSQIEKYDFPDQELLSEVFAGRWVSIPYVFNGLKTLRWAEVHGAIWRDEEVRAVHYIFGRKPWHAVALEGGDGGGDGDLGVKEKLDEPGLWWWEANWERKRLERKMGVEDGY